MSKYYKTKETVQKHISKGESFLNNCFSLFWSDVECQKMAMTKGQNILSLLPDLQNRDKDFVLLACRSSPHIYKTLSRKQRWDRDIALAAVRANGFLATDAPNSMWGDVEFVKLAYSYSPKDIRLSNEEILTNKELILELLEVEPEIYDYCLLKEDEDVVRKVLRYHQHYIQSVPTRFSLNVEWMQKMIAETPRIYNFASFSIRRIKSVVMVAFSGQTGAESKFIPDEVLRDKDICQWLLKKCSGIFERLPEPQARDISNLKQWALTSKPFSYKDACEFIPLELRGPIDHASSAPELGLPDFLHLLDTIEFNKGLHQMLPEKELTQSRIKI